MIDPKSLRIGNYIISTREYFDKPTLGRVYQISASNIFIEYTEDNGEIRGISNPLHVLSGIPLSEQELIRLGFEKKPIYGWKGNGADYQPETSKTEYQDYVIDAGDEDYFFVRYATWSYRKTERDQWNVDKSVFIHKGSWYERAEEQVPCRDINYIHDLQNLFYDLTGTELTYKVENETIKP